MASGMAIMEKFTKKKRMEENRNKRNETYSHNN